MIVKSSAIAIACASFLIINQAFFPNVLALKKPSNIDEFMVEDQRTHTRQNYVVQRALDNELRNMDNIGVAYATETFEPNTNPEDLPGLIVDYANMIRNDIILLDNSVETRTRKRGNIKVEKHNQAITDPPCTCETAKREIYLGEQFYPRYVNSSHCDNNLCQQPYRCQRNEYNITILRKRMISPKDNKSNINKYIPVADIPDELKYQWTAFQYPVTIGCTCVRDYIEQK